MRLPTIAAILKNHSSSDDDCLHLSIENPPYMRLVIEDVGLGPNKRPAISVAHYFEQNGDLCQDPEMCFEVERQSDEFTFNPYMFQQAIPPVYQEIESNSTDLVDFNGVGHIRSFLGWFLLSLAEVVKVVKVKVLAKTKNK